LGARLPVDPVLAAQVTLGMSLASVRSQLRLMTGSELRGVAETLLALYDDALNQAKQRIRVGVQ
jgi:hypothetical protein